MTLSNKYYLAKIISIAVLSLFTFFATTNSIAKDASGKVAKSLPAAVNVEVLPVKLQHMPKLVSSLGSLQAINKVTISSEVDGRIVKIYFKSGNQVGQGMPIVQLDDQSEKADYDKAVSQLNIDRLQLKSQLAAGDAIAQFTVKTTEATVKQDQTDVQSKQAALAKKQITAPFSGMLGDFQVNVGAFIKSGQAMVDLVNTEQLRAVYHLSEDMKPQLKLGQLATITVDAYPGKVFYGTVDYISPSIDKTARTIEVTALVQNPKNLLSPGVFIHVSQQVKLQKNALVIPEQAILVDIKGPYTYIIVNSRAKRVDLTVGTRKRGLAQITSGLKVGDNVVVAGQQKLDEGVRVHVVPTLPTVSKLLNKSNDGSQPADHSVPKDAAPKPAVTPTSSTPAPPPAPNKSNDGSQPADHSVPKDAAPKPAVTPTSSTPTPKPAPVLSTPKTIPAKAHAPSPSAAKPPATTTMTFPANAAEPKQSN